ncbi:hypothetical protein [Parasulfitobacter algicola]|uniref:Uncharacterized protein n=1 Tax=Parasulfitobacter algicola TaxID=2614809 RepID=A0ABX2ITQ0_9RHOB|nr:hypothetical protein [Sulfitobacter algicola]NSX54202.1 hypothetical protein [Sulfitobacter algicola]
MPHDIVNGHIGHNHPDHHLHSHIDPANDAALLQVLATQFIDGFVQAADKSVYLRLAAVPFEKPSTDGAKALKLVDVQLKTERQVGTASPSFGSRKLSYLPFPGPMVSERTNMSLIYVSMDEKTTLDIRDFLLSKKPELDQ